MSCELEKCPPTARAGCNPACSVGGPGYAASALTHRAGGQRSVSLEYQTCNSANLFDTLVTGMGLISLQRGVAPFSSDKSWDLALAKADVLEKRDRGML